MDLTNFLRVLDRRKWLMVAILSVAMTTTFLIVRQAPEVYRVSGQLTTGLVGNTGNTSGELGSLKTGKYETESRLKGLIELIRSPQVLSLVSYRLMLHDLDPNLTEGFRAVRDLRTQYSVTEIEAARRSYRQKLDSLSLLDPEDRNQAKFIAMIRSMDYAPSALKNGLLIRRIPGTDLIDIEFTSESPSLSAFVVNTLSQEFIRYYTYLRAKRGSEATAVIEEMVKEKRVALDQKLGNFTGNEGISSSELSELLEEIGQLQKEREQVQKEIFDALLRYETVRERIQDNPEMPYLFIEGNSDFALTPMILDRVSEVSQRYVRGKFTDRQEADTLADLRRQLSSRLDTFLRTALTPAATQNYNLVQLQIRAEVDRAMSEQMRQAIYVYLRELGASVGQIPLTQSNKEELVALEIARDDYLAALDKLFSSRLSSAYIGPGAVSQVAVVQPPNQPEPSQAFFLTILAGLISLGIGTLVIFIMEYLDRSIKFPSRLEAMIGIKLLGPLNRLQARNLDLVSLFSETSKNQSLETYKQLMRKLRFELLEAEQKIFLITSTQGGSGKTSLMVSLAYAMSLNGKKVLLVDANFKNNTLTQIIGASPTLEKYLNKEIPRRTLISNSIFEGVDVIGCEGGNFSPSEVFQGEPFTQLLQELKEEYDVILIEGSPLNEYSDSKEMVAYVERVIPVFSAGASVSAADEASAAYLLGLEDKLMGAVLNKVELGNLTL